MSDNYRLEQVADGAWAAIAVDAGAGVGNAGIARLDDGSSIVVDCGYTPAAGRDLREAAGELAGPVGRLVITHGDFDHYGGSAAFADLPILATGTTQATIEERGPLRAAALREELETERAAMQERRAPGWEWEQLDRIAVQLPFGVAVPTETYEDERDLGGAVVIDCGAAHTASDAVVWLPGTRVLYAGDLVGVQSHLNLTRGHPAASWLAILDRLAALGPEHVVPGHGPPAGPEALAAARRYVETVIELAAAAGEPELPQEFAGWSFPEGFGQNVAALRKR